MQYNVAEGSRPDTTGNLPVSEEAVLVAEVEGCPGQALAQLPTPGDAAPSEGSLDAEGKLLGGHPLGQPCSPAVCPWQADHRGCVPFTSKDMCK